VRDLVIDRCAEEDDPFVQQARVDVERALAARGLLDHHRNQGTHCRTSKLLAFRLVISDGRTGRARTTWNMTPQAASWVSTPCWPGSTKLSLTGRVPSRGSRASRARPRGRRGCASPRTRRGRGRGRGEATHAPAP